MRLTKFLKSTWIAIAGKKSFQTTIPVHLPDIDDAVVFYQTASRFTIEAHHRETDELIGRITIRLDDDKKRFWIFGLFVEPEYRRNGIGERLMRYALQSASLRWGKIPCYLSVKPDNAEAKALYFKLGFKKLKNRIKPNGSIVMKRRV